MEWSIYNYLYKSKKANAYLLYNSLSNVLVQLNEEDHNLLLKIKENPDYIDLKDKQFKFLFDSRFLVESNDNEVNKLILEAQNSRFNNLSLSLTIAPTRACNFACPYCYEDDRANKKMTKKVQTGILDFIKKRNALESLGVVWYGGEPTLSIPTIKYLSDEMQKLVKNYSAFMVTNGYNLDKISDSLEELKITGLQITLDGLKESHNKTRHLRGGGETFDKILSNIERVLSQNINVRISIRMNINKDNASQYVPLYHFLREKFGKKVSLYPAFVRDYGGGCKSGSCYENGYEKAGFLKKLFEEEEIYTKDIYPTRTSKGCMIQKMHAYVVGPEGELYKCWHHLGVPEKIVGNIFHPQIITNFSLLADLMIKGDVMSDDKCKACVLFPSCYGGCMDEKNRHQDYCIPAKSMLEDFIDIHYDVKTKCR